MLSFRPGSRASTVSASLQRLLRRSGEYVRHYVSPLGWSSLGIALIFLVFFLVWGWKEMLVISLFLSVLLIMAVVVSLGNVGLNAQITLSEPRVEVGESVRVTATLTNPHPTPTAHAHARLKVGDTFESFAVPALRPKHSTATTLTLTTTRRSVLTIGPLQIRKGDPFGLLRYELSVAKELTLFVHPKIVHLRSLDAGIIRDLEGTASEDIVDDDLSFYGLRDYQPGDDVRNVHWLTTAKTNHLMVRQFQASRKTSTSLSVQTHPAAYRTAEEFELAVSVGASLGVQCLLQDRPLTLHAGHLHSLVTQPQHFLDLCSAIAPEPSEPSNLAGSALELSPDSSLYLFVVGPLETVSSMKRMVSALPSTAVVLVIQIDSEASQSIRAYESFTLLHVSALDELPVTMEAAQ